MSIEKKTKVTPTVALSATWDFEFEPAHLRDCNAILHGHQILQGILWLPWVWEALASLADTEKARNAFVQHLCDLCGLSYHAAVGTHFAYLVSRFDTPSIAQAELVKLGIWLVKSNEYGLADKYRSPWEVLSSFYKLSSETKRREKAEADAQAEAAAAGQEPPKKRGPKNGQGKGERTPKPGGIVTPQDHPLAVKPNSDPMYLVQLASAFNATLHRCREAEVPEMLTQEWGNAAIKSLENDLASYLAAQRDSGKRVHHAA